AVLESHAHIAAHHHGLRCERYLKSAGAQHRPAVVVAEQLVRCALHEREVIDVAADAAQNAEYQLQEDRRPEHAAVDAMREIIEVSDVIAFVLEFGPFTLAHELRYLFDIPEGIAENVLIGGEQILLLP